MTIARQRRIAIIFAAALALAATASAYRPPKNPHHKKKLTPYEALISSATLVTQIDRLEAGRWDPKIKLALEKLAADKGKDGGNYDPNHPPTALISFDDAAISGDLGELVFARMVERAEFKFDDAWWNIVPLAYGRQKIRAAQEQFITTPPAVWDQQPAFHQYVKGMLASYQGSCKFVSFKDCRIYIARLFKGYSNEQVLNYSKKTFDDAEVAPIKPVEVREYPEDPAPVKFRRGLREVPEMKDLVELLLKSGFDVWVVGLDAVPVLRAYAAGYHIDLSRVIGINQGVFRERLNGKVDEPVPARQGKVEAVVAALGRPPALIIGASADDRELLDYGFGVKVLLDGGDKVLADYAKRRGWLMQPSFVQR